MNIFIEKRPIVDEKINLIGYEINFRGIENNFNLLNESFAKEIFLFLESLIIDKLSDKKLFIKFNNKMLFEDSFINKLPKEKVIIDLDMQITRDVSEKIKLLHKNGFLIAFNDMEIESELLNLANFIKIDSSKFKKNSSKAKLIAKNTNTKTNFKSSQELGFNYFEGYFFLEPTIDVDRRIKPDEMSLFKILSLINQNAEVEEIVEIFKQAPTLSFQLLSVLNSPLLSLRKEITSIKHAIVLLGLDALKKWIVFLTFLEGTSEENSKEKFEENILSKEALKRAKYLESLSDKKESAFMVGLLSLIDVALSTSKEEILTHMVLPDEIKYAILREDGKLGKFLKLIKFLEDANFSEFKNLANELNINLNEFNEIHKKIIVS